MDYEDLIYDVTNMVATITINRPERMNAFRVNTYFEMIDALTAAGKIILQVTDSII